MPGDEYLKDAETVRSWNFSLTPVSWRKEDLKNRLARSERLLKGEEEIPLVSTGEEGVLLIKALLGLTRVISNVNLPNDALQIPNLPADAVVETNAVFAKNSVRPVYAGEIPDGIRELVLPHVENHERIFRAAYGIDHGLTREECLELVREAFRNDPLVKGHHPDEQQISELVEDMIHNTKAYLPEEWSK